MIRRKRFGLSTALIVLAMAGAIRAGALSLLDDPAYPRNEPVAGSLVVGDVNADQKVNLADVISVLRLMTAGGGGPVGIGGDVDGDGRIFLADALYLLRIIAAADAALQPAIDGYLANLVDENTLSELTAPEMERLFYHNGDTGPALKIPTIAFDGSVVEFSVDLGSHTPPDGPVEPVDAVRVLLYDSAAQAWAYGVNRDSQTSFLVEAPHGNDFSATYSLLIDGLGGIPDGAARIMMDTRAPDPVRSIGDADPSRGTVLYVNTKTGNAYVVGENGAVRVMPGNSIQEKAAAVSSLPVKTDACTCPDVNVLDMLQKSFEKEGVALTADHLDERGFKPVFACGETIETFIRLGDDLEVLESQQKLGRRIDNSDYRIEEPEGHFRGAHYHLYLRFYSYCDPRTCTCKCEFAWRIVAIETGVIEKAGFVRGGCGNLEGEFDIMLGEIEIELNPPGGADKDFYMLPDTPIPDCEDGNPCTHDLYNPETGICEHWNAAPGTACDDSDPCTISDACASGQCSGTPKPCDDGNTCTEDSCDPGTGDCLYGSLADGTPCNDGNPSTMDDECDGGVCRGIDPNAPLPGVPVATGQPEFDPNPVQGNGDTTTVYIPVTEDTQFVYIILFRQDTNTEVVFLGEPVLQGTSSAEVTTPWINSQEGQLYLEFSVENHATGAFSYYSRDMDSSGEFYTVHQEDDQGRMADFVSNIPIAWLSVVKPN